MSRRQTLAPLSPNSKGGAPGRCPKEGTALSKSRKSVAPGMPLALAAGGPDRRSSVVGHKPGAPKQDPRPLNSKDFQANCIKTIVTYLATNKFATAVSAKTLQSPTGKDFAAIVTFLFQQIDPAFRIQGKVEDEVPAFFKRLNYPFQISKSALFAVGTPHSWPAILAALTWLVEALEYAERANSSKAADFDNKEEAFFDYLAQGYHSFLSCDDDRCQQLDEEFAKKYIARSTELDQRNAELQQRNQELVAELAKLRSLRDPVELAIEQRSDQMTDNKKLDELVQQDQVLKQTALRKLAEKKADVQAKAEQISAAVAEVDQLRHRVAGQTVNKAEFNRLLLDRQKHADLLAVERAKCEDLENKKHEMDVQILRMTTELETHVGRFNQLANRLKLIPATLKRANGINYDLRINRDAASQAEFSNLDLKGVVKPNLERLVDNYRTRASQLSQDLTSAREALQARAEQNAEKQEENKQLQEQISNCEAALQAAKDAQDEKCRKILAQAESTKAQVEAHYSAASHEIEHMDEQLSRAQLKYEQTKRESEAELAKLDADLRKAINAFVAHKEFVTSTISRTAAVVRQAHEEVSALHKTRLFADMEGERRALVNW